MLPEAKKKKQRLDGPVAGAPATGINDLSTDVLANIFSFLTHEEIMRARLNTKMREAAKTTIVPMVDFCIDRERKINLISAMTTALPNLQQLSICRLSERYVKYSDGMDPSRDTSLWSRLNQSSATVFDIETVSAFRNLRMLAIDAPLNGRYPRLFNFPLLQKLKINITVNRLLKLDLEMLAAGLPLLKELFIAHEELDYEYDKQLVSGNINSLRVLKDTLTNVTINYCINVDGNFMDLADFPHLKTLDLIGTNVTGDMREIDEHDFTTLELLTLPSGVYGGVGHQLQHVSEANDLMRAIHAIRKQHPSLSLFFGWHALLSEDSPDSYEVWEVQGGDIPDLPHYLVFVKAGSRSGYRWQADVGYDCYGEGGTFRYRGCSTCEVNWLDPEPDRESSDYDKYLQELQEIERNIDFYRGCHNPPTEAEHDRLMERAGYHLHTL